MSGPVYSTGNIRNDIRTDSDSWSGFAEFWDDLPLDEYMGDGGTYRRRKFSRISYEPGDGAIRVHDEARFLQTREVNRLNGGVARKFRPVDPALLENAIVRQLLAHFAARADHAREPVRTVNIHQHRITATEEEAGNPSPEGAHRDGVEYIAMLMVARQNLTGGMSTLYDNAGTPVLDHTLSDPGDYIFVDDRTCMHSTTPVAVTPPAAKGHRDMFFLEFC